jgi:glycosyltransferase involved in cell wall biosynthesis
VIDPATEIEFCVLIPAYEEEQHVGDIVREVKKYVDYVVVVDDGSVDRTTEEARMAGASVVTHEVNQGKGVALRTGFAAAKEHGAGVIIVMDADGQHDPEDIPRFIEAYNRTGIPVLLGNRMADSSHMPLVRRLTNEFMSWLLSREMKQYVPDTQCGYRLYRLDIIPYVSAESGGYAAESEILLHIAARGLRMDSVPIKAVYRDERSRINPFGDTFKFFSMLHRYRKSNSKR